MAKDLKTGMTYIDYNGDEWDNAILTVDYTDINWLDQIMKFTVCIYKDSTARNERYLPISKKFVVDKETFLIEFDQTEAIGTLKSQCETYALTLKDHNGEFYGTYFE
jgi:hypothetical protein